MKWRKAASGMLAYVLAFTTAASAVPATTVSAAQDNTGTAAVTSQTPTGPTQIGIPEFTALNIKEGDHPSDIEMNINEKDKKLFKVIDRADNPANFELEGDDGSVELLNGKWGFNQKIVSTDERFNVSGDRVMVISFDLYLNTLNVEYENGATPTLISKGNQQYCVSVKNNGFKTHHNPGLGGENPFENQASDNCFSLPKKWYHVDIVYGKNGRKQNFVDGVATGELQEFSQIKEYPNAPFTIGFRYEGDDSTSGKILYSTEFTEDRGYLADVKFYNGDMQNEIQNGIDLVGWNADEDKGYAKLRDLLNSVKPVSDFSVRPYTESVTWSEKGTSGQALTVADQFQCGTVYQATETLTAGDGYVFPESVSKDDIVVKGLQYKKITGLSGEAESNENSSATDLPADAAVDGDEGTHWHSNWSSNDREKDRVQGTKIEGSEDIWDLTSNNTYTITLPEETAVKKFEYVGRSSNGKINGDIHEAVLEASTDGENFEEIKGVSFGYATENKSEVIFDEPIRAKKIRIRGKKSYGADGCYMSAKEFYLYSPEIETESVRLEKITGLTGVAESYANSGSDQPASGALDDNLNTLWHSYWAGGGGNEVFVEGEKTSQTMNSYTLWNLTGKNTVTITLPTVEKVQRFEYVGRDGNNGDIYEGYLEYSATADGDNFKKIEGSEFGYGSNVFTVDFAPVGAKRIRVVGTKAYSNNSSRPFMSAKEFRLFKPVNLPVSPTVSSTEVSQDRKTLTVTFEYPSLNCDSFISSVAFRSPVNLEVGNTYQINPSEVFAADGKKIDNHPALNTEYHYECSDSSVITVSSNGIVTAKGEGTATVTVTTEAGNVTYTSEIQIKVYDKDTMLLHPELIYAKPEADKYPEVADVRMNVTRDDPYMGVITEIVEGGSALEPAGGNIVIERHDGVVGFNGVYKATGVDKQFNTAGEDPLVIAFKLYLKRLPRDNREHTILSKGNQYNLSYMNDPDNTENVILRLQIGNGWTKWKRTIVNTDIKKWLDIMIVADGKGTADSVKLYVDGVPVAEKSGNGTSIEATDPDNNMRPFTLFDKEEANGTQMSCGADLALISGLKVYDVKDDAPNLVNDIDITTLGVDKASAAIKSMLDGVKPSSYMTATPYSIQTTWYKGTGADKVALDGKTKFTDSDILGKGYTAVTVLTANKKADGNFYEFDRAEEEHINEDLRHIFTKDDTKVDNEDAMILRKAQVSADQKTMTVEISFLPTGVPAPRIEFTAPRVGLTPREYPITNDSSATRRYDFEENAWYSVNAAGAKTAITEGSFAAITADNKYQVETILTARDGYRFDSSTEYQDRVKETIKLQRAGNVTADVDVEAQENGKKLKITVLYNTPIHTVSYDFNGLAQTPFRQAVSDGNTAVKPDDPVRAGYRFDRWCLSKTTHTEFNFDTKITEDITLTAHWTEVKKVEYVTNRADITLEPDTYAEGVTAQAPEMKRPEGDEEKVTFEGWYTDMTFREGTEFEFGQELERDIVLYAKWTVTIMYDENYEGAPTHEPITTTINKKLSGLDEDLNRTGYRFDGWFTNKDGDGMQADLTRGVTENTVFYAKWVPQVTVTFDSGDGADTSITPPAPQEIDRGERASRPSDPKPKDDAQVFIDWFEKDKDNNFNADPYDFDAPVNSDITLYGRWAGSDELWTVTFMVDNKEVAKRRVLKNGETGSKTTAPNITPEPYKMLYGWFTDAACTQPFNFATNIKADTTLYAKWAAVLVNISFVVNGGTDVAAEKHEANTALVASKLPSPTRSGYTFDGWYMDRELQTPCNGEVVKEDTRLYAKWNLKPLTGVAVTSPKNITLSEDGEADVAYDLAPADVRNVTVSFSSGDESIATVSNQGRITAKAAGNAVITVSAVQGDITKTDTINVKVVKNPTNIARNATPEANNLENDQHVATNINDGKANTKWACDIWGGNEGGYESDKNADGAKRYRDWDLEAHPDHDSVQVVYEWPEEITFQKTVLNWERRNTGRYTLAVSADGTNWKVVYAKDLAKANINQTDSLAETIVFGEPVAAKYLRIEVTKIYAKSGDWESEGGNGWSGCGIYEWDVYDIAEEGYPVFTNPAQIGTEVSATAGTAFEYTPAAGGAAISVTTDMTGLSGAKFENGKLSWTPASTDVGSYYVTFKAEKDGKASFQTITLKVAAGTTPPPSGDTEKDTQKQNRVEALAKAEKIDMSTGAATYTAATWGPFKAAYDELKNLTDAQIEAMTAAQLKTKVDALVDAQKALAKNTVTPPPVTPPGPGDDKNTAVENANTALKDAEKLNPATADQSKYTAESWKNFVDAFNALNNLTEDQIKNMSAEELQALTDALINAQKALAGADNKVNDNKKVDVSSLKMSASKYQFAKNKTINMADELSVLPENATDKKVTWSSSNTKVATINPATGQLKTTKKVGKTQITATSSNGKKVTVTVQVMKGAVSKVKAKGKKKVTVKAGKSVTLKTVVATKGGKANKKLKWTSSDPSAVAVSNGTKASMKVKAAKTAKNKTVKITATSTDGTKKKIVFTVKVK